MTKIKLPKDYTENYLKAFRFKNFLDYTNVELAKFAHDEISALASISNDSFDTWRTDTFEFLKKKDIIERKLNDLGYTLCLVFREDDAIASYRVIKTKKTI